MKALLLAVCLALSLGSVHAADPVFIVVTVETAWDGGWVSPVGYVEHLASETATSYVVATAGMRFDVPKANARIISAAEAALRLIAQRAALEAAATAAHPVAAAPARPTQRNGQPLPSNWIDPDLADARHFAAQAAARMRALEAEVARLRQQRK